MALKHFPCSHDKISRSEHQAATRVRLAMTGDGAEAEMARQLTRLNALINEWRCRERVQKDDGGGGGGGGLELVRCSDVLPDWTNRERTGVSLEHCHWLAHKFRDEGFQPRRRGVLGQGPGRGLEREDGGHRGHEIPVVVRESSESRLGAAALSRWCEFLRNTPGLPPCVHCSGSGEAEDEKARGEDAGGGLGGGEVSASTSAADSGAADACSPSGSSRPRPARRIFTSLGSSHFNQALNLHLREWNSIFDGRVARMGITI